MIEMNLGSSKVKIPRYMLGLSISSLFSFPAYYINILSWPQGTLWVLVDNRKGLM